MPDELDLTADEVGGGEGGDVAIDESVEVGDSGGNEEVVEEVHEEGTDEGGDRGTDREEEPEREEPEVSEFRGQVSSRLRGMVKAAPELSGLFKKYPKLQGEIEATFRRDAAMRDIFPTVAEARQMRERFPNGLQDVQELLNDAQEIEELDTAFEKRNSDGSYPGHEEIIENMFQQDKAAAVNLFKTLPKAWARLDRESYNEVITKIIGATFKQRQVESFLSELFNIAKDDEQKELQSGLGQLLQWVQGFTKEKQRTQEDEDRERERQGYERERSERDKADNQRFHASFRSSQLALQKAAINNHPAIKRMVQALNKRPEKRDAIIENVRTKIEKFLSSSPSFMRKLKAAYMKRDLDGTAGVAKAAWSMPWLMNRMVRAVLTAEVPELVQAHRAIAKGAQQRKGTPQNRSNAGGGGGGKSKPTAPFQSGGQWYWPDGKRMTTAEVLSGKHKTA